MQDVGGPPQIPPGPVEEAGPGAGKPVHPGEGQSPADLLPPQTRSGATPSLGSLSPRRTTTMTQRTTKPSAPAWWPSCRRTGDGRGPKEPSCRPLALSSTWWALQQVPQPVSCSLAWPHPCNTLPKALGIGRSSRKRKEMEHQGGGVTCPSSHTQGSETEPVS